MKRFTSWDGIEIAYQEWGDPAASPAVVLHHGFVVNAKANWVATGVVEALVQAGHRVIAPDARGHGASEKPHDPDRYGEDKMARDLAGLLEVEGITEIDLVGYSMGAIVALIFAGGEGADVRRLIVGGVGSGVIECGGVDRRAVSNDSIIEALSVEDPSTIAESPAAGFRMLADALGSDRQALEAQARSIFRGDIPLASISAETLVLAGESDPLAVRPELLSGAIEGARLQLLAGDHISVLGDPHFKSSIVDFLG